MKLRTKLIAAPVVTAVVALGAGGANAWLMHANADRERQELAEDIGDYKAMGAAQAQLGATQSSIYRTLAILNSLDERKVKDFVGHVHKDLDAVQRALQGVAGHADAGSDLRRKAEALLPLAERYVKQATKAIELTSVDVNMGVGAMKAAEKSYDELSSGMVEVVALTEAAYQARQADVRSREWTEALLFGLLAFFVTGVVVAGSWLVQRRLAADIARAVELSREVARGNLRADASTARDDEIGELLRALGAMVAQLRESMQTVREATQSIGGAAAEIASGNADLSQRTEQAAGHLQQTASSMEQLTGTVTQTAQSARTASQLASSASSVAQRGGAVVSQVVATMGEINASSRKISDIIGTIDGIAFQTNILALNAAVEAARAGEQGRGFAVVAAEVRSLAQRSAAAAREIKSLIGASVEKVDAGARLVGDAGQTMDEIVASVQRVNDIISEISAAAAEQSEGIGTVNQAVVELDQTTQQNAALVEQSAAAAESLNQQARRLAEVVGRFRIDDGEAPPPVASAPAQLARATLERVRARVDAATPRAAAAVPEWESF